MPTPSQVCLVRLWRDKSALRCQHTSQHRHGPGGGWSPQPRWRGQNSSSIRRFCAQSLSRISELWNPLNPLPELEVVSKLSYRAQKIHHVEQRHLQPGSEWSNLQRVTVPRGVASLSWQHNVMTLELEQKPVSNFTPPSPSNVAW